MFFTPAEVEEFRRDAEDQMVDQFQAWAPGEPIKVDRVEVPGYADRGKTKGKTQGGSASTIDGATEFVEIGGVKFPIIRGGLHIPISSPAPVAGKRGKGWEYECINLGPYSDHSLLGRRYLVHHAPAKTLATARRLDVIDITDLEEVADP